MSKVMVVLIDMQDLESWLEILSGIVKTLSEMLDICKMNIIHEKWTY